MLNLFSYTSRLFCAVYESKLVTSLKMSLRCLDKEEKSMQRVYATVVKGKVVINSGRVSTNICCCCHNFP